MEDEGDKKKKIATGAKIGTGDQKKEQTADA